jgi:HlyD family secretion protein
MKRRSWIAIAVVALLVAGIAYRYRQQQQSPSYVTAVVTRGDVTKSVSASGTLKPVTLVNVGTQVSGVVQKLHADFNDRVTAGQILAELDPALLKAQQMQSQGNLAAATANLQQAKQNFARIKTLFDQDYVAKAELDVAHQALDSASAAVKTAEGQVQRDQVNLRYSVIRSPVSGVVVDRTVDVGQTVAASFQTPTLFSIAQDLQKMQIDTNLSEADVGAVQAGMKAIFSVDAFPGRQFAGTVRQVRLNPTTVQNVVTYNVVVDVNNEDLTLLPGMTAFVNLVLQEKPAVLRVPNSALNYRPAAAKEQAKPNNKPLQDKGADQAGSASVYLLKDGQPLRQRITIGVTDGKLTEVVDGLAEGDVLVIGQAASGTAGGSSKSSNSGGPGGPPRMF